MIAECMNTGRNYQPIVNPTSLNARVTIGEKQK